MSNVILVLDSVSSAGSRLSTFELTMSVACLGQITKHRSLSINAESARAVPTRVAMQQVLENPWVPRSWPQNGKGMQPPGPIEDRYVPGVEAMWRQAARDAVRSAGDLLEFGVHKEVVNRVLAPFRRIKVVVSGTGNVWPNFFALRCAPEAQEEIRDLAQEMRGLLEASTPEERVEHLPFLSTADWDEARTWSPLKRPMASLRLVSAYRAARVSYGRTGASGLTLEEEAAKGQALADAGHWSALEHTATAIPGEEDPLFEPHKFRSGNMVGWRSLRETLGGMK
jgi:thymidylate synthase ThyX